MLQGYFFLLPHFYLKKKGNLEGISISCILTKRENKMVGMANFIVNIQLVWYFMLYLNIWVHSSFSIELFIQKKEPLFSISGRENGITCSK